jgi:hypothetical protein
MVVDGSSSPVSYTFGIPENINKCYDVYGLRFHIICATEPDDTKFGDKTALDRGIVIRQHMADGTVYEHAVIRSNGDLQIQFDNYSTSDKAGGGKFSVLSDWKIREDEGVSIRIDAAEKVEVLIQDAITVDGLEVWIYGHEVEN